jgi:gamma-glutamylcysteine synthetase
MKREFLEGLGLEKEVVDKIMAENGADLEKEKAKTNAAKADLAEAKEKIAEVQSECDQLKASNGDVAAVQKELDDLRAKYDADIADRENQLAARDYEDAINRAIAGKSLKFSSKYAEKAFKNLLKEKKLEVKDGELDGLDDFIKEQKAADPDAFAPDKPTAKIVSPTGGGSNPPSTHQSTHQTVAEQLASSIGKAKADSGKAANDVISM